MSSVRMVRIVGGIVAFCLVVILFPLDAGAADGDIGYRGPSYSEMSDPPSGSKPESKLWWNDGAWWASMFDTVREGN